MQVSDNMCEFSVSEVQMVSGGSLIDIGIPMPRDPNRKIPFMAFIGRLEEQKGVDVMAEAISVHDSDGVEITLLGSGIGN